jgi:hypothetical protein
MKEQFDLSDLIALPGMPHMSVEIAPGVCVPVDEVSLSEKKDAFISYCKSLPAESLITKNSIVGITNGNETLAGLLVALADKFGVWGRHPPIQIPALWVPSIHPMVLADSVVATKASRVPKPSTGDLEKGLVQCLECGALVGKYDSISHEHKESTPDGVCNLCEYESGSKPSVQAKKSAPKDDDFLPPTPEMPEPSGPISGSVKGLSAYLSAMNEG